MSINSRQKGKNGELEFSAIILEQTGIRLHRNLDQTRSGGYDLVVADDAYGPAADALRGFAIECKRHKSATQSNLDAWWQQAYKQAKEAEKIPLLAYRADRQPWRVVIPMSKVNGDLPYVPIDLTFTATFSPEGFGAVLRECG